MTQNKLALPNLPYFNPANLTAPEQWRFVLLDSGEVKLLSRYPLLLNNADLGELLKTNSASGLDVAAADTIRAAFTPVGVDETSGAPVPVLLKEQAFRYPWGREAAATDAPRLCVDNRLNLAGMYGGGNALWMICHETIDGKKVGTRLGASYTVEVFDGSKAEGATATPGDRGDLYPGARGNLKPSKIIKPAGFYANREPEPIEATVLEMNATQAQADFYKTALTATRNRFGGDSGIMVLSPQFGDAPSGQKAYFDAAGLCYDCTNRTGLTLQLTKGRLKEAVATTIEFYPDIAKILGRGKG